MDSLRNRVVEIHEDLGQKIGGLFQEFFQSLSELTQQRQSEDQNASENLLQLVNNVTTGMEQLTKARQIASIFANSITNREA
ncbi:hypothetical protein GEMRC1_008636 [Eukaryota sp. GEM-RC1]